MIRILSTITTTDFDGSDESRCVSIIITDNGNFFQLHVGGLPLTGDLQPVLDDRHEELLDVAIAKGHDKTTEQVRHLLYNAAWSTGEFQSAVIANMAENVGGSLPAFAEINEKYDLINDEWPVKGGK